MGIILNVLKESREEMVLITFFRAQRKKKIIQKKTFFFLFHLRLLEVNKAIFKSRNLFCVMRLMKVRARSMEEVTQK